MIYTDLATCFGWTWEYIDEFVTVPRLLEISAAWRSLPPLHRAFAGFVAALGGKTSSPSRPMVNDEKADGGELLRDLAAAGIALAPGMGPGAVSPALIAMLDEG